VRAALAVAIGAAICVLLHAAVLLAVALVVTVGVGLVARHALAGITGDVLGATAELCELTALVVAVALT
jgi:adenosylcobinamide-GDP ribazoletransferase